MSKTFKGYALGILAAASYGTNPLFALPLYSTGLTVDTVLFYRYALGSLMIWLILHSGNRHGRISLPRRSMAQTAVMGTLMAISSLSLFASYNYMDAGIASTMLFVYPIMVAILMAVFFREKIRRQTILCIAMCLTGIGLLFKSDGGGTVSLTGTALVMLSSLSYAVYIVGMKTPRLSRIPTLTAVYIILLTGTVLFGIRLAVSGSHTLPSTVVQWAFLLALAMLPTVVSFFCTTKAIELIGPTPTAILGAFEPVTAVAIGVCVFGEALTLRSTAGIALIIIAVIVINRR